MGRIVIFVAQAVKRQAFLFRETFCTQLLCNFNILVVEKVLLSRPRFHPSWKIF